MRPTNIVCNPIQAWHPGQIARSDSVRQCHLSGMFLICISSSMGITASKPLFSCTFSKSLHAEMTLGSVSVASIREAAGFQNARACEDSQNDGHPSSVLRPTQRVWPITCAVALHCDWRPEMLAVHSTLDGPVGAVVSETRPSRHSCGMVSQPGCEAMIKAHA